jgi:DNA primase large subunit
MIKQSRRASGFTAHGGSERGLGSKASTLGPGHPLQVLRHVDPRLSQYPFTLNFYGSPPPFELTLDEFELFSLDRLKLLKAVETAKLRCKKEEDVFKAMEPAVADLMDLGRNAPGLTKPKAQLLYEQRRKDHISHFLLRLAFCRSEELRVWFTRLELILFKFRYVKEAAMDREAFLSSVSLDAFPTTLEGMLADFYPKDHLETDQVQAAHKARLMNEIRSVYSLDMDAIKTASFYKVPFEQVLELISRKAVLLKDGWAYVPESERILLVVNAFKTSLLRGLEETAKALPRMEEDDRCGVCLDTC